MVRIPTLDRVFIPRLCQNAERACVIHSWTFWATPMISERLMFPRMIRWRGLLSLRHTQLLDPLNVPDAKLRPGSGQIPRRLDVAGWLNSSRVQQVVQENPDHSAFVGSRDGVASRRACGLNFYDRPTRRIEGANSRLRILLMATSAIQLILRMLTQSYGDKQNPLSHLSGCNQ